MVVNNVKGTVTYNDIKKSKKGNNMRVLKVLQVDIEGNGSTFPLYLSDVTLFKDLKVGQEVVIPSMKIDGQYFCSTLSQK